jgi:hypothetical protein
LRSRWRRSWSAISRDGGWRPLSARKLPAAGSGLCWRSLRRFCSPPATAWASPPGIRSSGTSKGLWSARTGPAGARALSIAITISRPRT